MKVSTNVGTHFLTAALSFAASIIFVALSHAGSTVGYTSPVGVCITAYSGNSDQPLVSSVAQAEIVDGVVSCLEGTFTSVVPATPQAGG